MIHTAQLRSRSHLIIAAALALVGLAGLACDEDHGGDYPEVDCSTADVKSFAEMTVWGSCTSCHSSALSGSSRQSAPEGVDFDSFEAAMAQADHAAAEVAEDEMPPGGGLSEDAKNELYAWARCGTPQ
ncbi:MAG: hypothetical protein H6713_03585 [Myxococcales bacterium]|nr:hypothetical protein [Myxococcales bacterium]